MTKDIETNAIEANVDNSEIEKFNASAANWWDTNGELRTLHDINPVRLGYIQDRCSLNQQQVLDVGCGGGILTEALAQQGANAMGLDMAPDSIKVAQQHASQQNLDIQYVQMPIEEFAEQNAERFDAISCMEMLEHVPDPASIVNACSKLLKPGGDLFLSTINRNLKSYTMAIVGAEYILNLIPKGTHEYNKLIKPSELAAWCRDAELQVLDTTGMHYNPLSRRAFLNRDVSVNYLMHVKKPA